MLENYFYSLDFISFSSILQSGTVIQIVGKSDIEAIVDITESQAAVNIGSSDDVIKRLEIYEVFTLQNIFLIMNYKVVQIASFHDILLWHELMFHFMRLVQCYPVGLCF